MFSGCTKRFFYICSGKNVFALTLNRPKFWNLESQNGWNKEKEQVIYWQKNLRRGHSLSHRDILLSRWAKGEKQWPWKDDMPAQCHYCRNDKGCCWATRIRGHGNRGVFNVPESIMLLLPYSNASLQRSCPLMYLSQANTILILMSAPSLSHFLHPSPAHCGCQLRILTCDSRYVCLVLMWVQVRIDAVIGVLEDNTKVKA